MVLVAWLGLCLAGCPSDRTTTGNNGKGVDDVPFGGFGDKDTGVSTVSEPDTFTPEPDIEEADIEAPDTAEDAGPAVDVGPCASGPCNDGDACTVNDECKGGVCAGQPVDCDDGVVCTTDSCTDGLCASVVAQDFCHIGGVCYANGDKNPQNGCERCAGPSSQTNWSALTGACDDGDDCTTDQCQGGVCLGTPIGCPDDGNPCTLEECATGGLCVTKSASGACEDGNPCTQGDVCDKSVCKAGTPTVCLDDGDPCTTEACGSGGCVSTPVPGCGEVQDECTGHADCNPAGVCAQWLSTGIKKCSAPCAGPSDCAATETCTKMPGSANVGFCQGKIPGGFGVGTLCNLDKECSSGNCAGVCVDTCLDEPHCTVPGWGCTPADDLANGLITTVCYEMAFLPNGQKCCTPDGSQCGGALCQSGHCDLTGGDICSPTCTSEADCGAGQECNIVFYSPTANPKTVPFNDTITSLRHDVLLGCYTQAQVGFKSEGQLCNTDMECLSAKCLQLDLNNPAKYCTSFCTDDAECPPTLKCKLDALGLTSTWLTNPTTGSQEPNTLATTYVRVCRLP